MSDPTIPAPSFVHPADPGPLRRSAGRATIPARPRLATTLRRGGAASTRAAARLRVALALALAVGSGACAGGTERRPAGPDQAGAPESAEQRRHVVLMAGRPAGEQVVTRRADDALEVSFSFKDRGRGPSYHSVIELDPRGLPVRIETEGHDYLASPVEERFALEDGRATWHNSAESGSRALPAGADAPPGVYLSLYGAPLEIALLARALLARPERSLPLLPDGRASIEELTRHRVRSADGRTKTVTLYALTGIGFSPLSIWLDADRRFFAAVSAWFGVIEAGFEGVADELIEVQGRSEAARRRALAERLAHRPPGPLVFRRVRVFDPEALIARPDMTVVVEGDRITRVGPAAEVEIPAGATVLDGAGKTLLPGLWDMHVHLGEDDGVLHLAAGVTSVRDLANDIDTLAEYRRDHAAGRLIGPRLVAAGFMDGPGPYAGPTKVLVDSEAEARAAIDRYAELGYVQIKIYSSIRPELVPAIIEHAHARGLRVSGHIPAFMRAEEVVRLGLDEIQHINFLVLNFLFDEVKDTRTPARFTAVGEHAAELDLDGPEVQAFIDLLVQRDVVVDPTLSIFEVMFVARPGEPPPGFEAIVPRLPMRVRRSHLSGGLPVTDETGPRYRASFEAMLGFVGALHRAGVRLVAGTDSLAGFTLHRELENYVRAGIPAPEVLAIATLRAARVAGRDAELGSIEPGKLADLVLVEGDPTADIRDVGRVDVTVLGGVLHRPDELHRAAGVKPR